MSITSLRRRLEVEDNGDVTIVHFVDRKILDEPSIQKMGEDLFSLVDGLGRKKILLNFRNVNFLSSAAMGKLITLHKKIQARAGKLVMCNIASEISQVFVITNLNRLFNIQKDEQSALQEF